MFLRILKTNFLVLPHSAHDSAWVKEEMKAIKLSVYEFSVYPNKLSMPNQRIRFQLNLYTKLSTSMLKII